MFYRMTVLISTVLQNVMNYLHNDILPRPSCTFSNTLLTHSTVGTMPHTNVYSPGATSDGQTGIAAVSMQLMATFRRLSD
jgi:hypothetical protein